MKRSVAIFVALAALCGFAYHEGDWGANANITALGRGSATDSVSQNLVAIGRYAGAEANPVDGSVFIGSDAGRGVATNVKCVAIGNGALTEAVSACRVVAIGENELGSIECVTNTTSINGGQIMVSETFDLAMLRTNTNMHPTNSPFFYGNGETHIGRTAPNAFIGGTGVTHIVASELRCGGSASTAKSLAVGDSLTVATNATVAGRSVNAAFSDIDDLKAKYKALRRAFASKVKIRLSWTGTCPYIGNIMSRKGWTSGSWRTFDLSDTTSNFGLIGDMFGTWHTDRRYSVNVPFVRTRRWGQASMEWVDYGFSVFFAEADTNLLSVTLAQDSLVKQNVLSREQTLFTEYNGICFVNYGNVADSTAYYCLTADYNGFRLGKITLSLQGGVISLSFDMKLKGVAQDTPTSTEVSVDETASMTMTIQPVMNFPVD